VSLFDFTGIWSRPYRVPGYEVHQIDLQHGRDCLEYTPPRRPWGVLAAPPCTIWTNANAHRWPTIDDAAFFLNLALVLHSWQICQTAIAWHCLENPRGRLSALLGPPAMEFQPHHFGDPWTKRTCLWGCFTAPLRRQIIPTYQAVGGRLNHRHPLLPWLSAATTQAPHNHPKSNQRYNSPTFRVDRQNARSATPPAFAQAFARANP
jgi:hypothetical protein